MTDDSKLLEKEDFVLILFREHKYLRWMAFIGYVIFSILGFIIMAIYLVKIL